MTKIVPRWAPRVKQHKIRRLYESDARGLCDDELIEEVGYSLLARCQSFLEATEATNGRAPCPVCGNVIPHAWNKEELLQCTGCGWQLTWGEYFETIQRKQLSGAEPVRELFRDFVGRFPLAQRPQDKMLLIDQLIHGYHWSLKYGPTRPVAVNLITGRLGEVIAFLDSLSYGEGSTPGIEENRVEWLANSQYVRSWSTAKRKKPQNSQKGQFMTL
jgi:hypothetical protein